MNWCALRDANYVWLSAVNAAVFKVKMKAAAEFKYSIALG